MAAKLTNKQIIDALVEMRGALYLAAKKLNCSPQTIYNRMAKTPSIKAAIEDARGETVDIAEQKLRAAILNGEPWAVAMTLKTIGKNRGYIEKQEIESGGKVEIIVRHNDRAEPSHTTPEAEGDLPIPGETEDIS
jgi:hypothetical protein